MKWWGQMSWTSFFWTLSFKPAFSLSSFTFIRRLFGSSSLCAIRVISSVYRWRDQSLYKQFSSVQFNLVTQPCPTFCNPIDCSTPGFHFHRHLPELDQTHVHWVGDAIQPSHPLLSPSYAFNISQHQGLFKWVSSLHQAGIELDFSFSISPSNEYSGLISFRWTGWNFLQLKGLLSIFSTTTVQKHQFFSPQLSLRFNSHIHTWLLGKP